MKWAFWRRDDRADSARGRAADSDDSVRPDPAAALRIRARRRLIGAAALLLAAVIIVPMVLDPAPRPVPDTVPIDIPSEKTPFTPRLALPPVPEPASAPMAPPDVAPAPEGKGDAAAESKGETTKAETSAEKKAEAPKADGKAEAKAEPRVAAKSEAKADAAEAQRAREILEGKAAGDKKGGKIVLQAAAFGSEAGARDLSERLKKAGFAPFTEKVDTKDGPRWRVRIGPYASREDAERARARLKALDVNASVVVGG